MGRLLYVFGFHIHLPSPGPGFNRRPCYVRTLSVRGQSSLDLTSQVVRPQGTATGILFARGIGFQTNYGSFIMATVGTAQARRSPRPYGAGRYVSSQRGKNSYFQFHYHRFTGPFPSPLPPKYRSKGRLKF